MADTKPKRPPRPKPLLTRLRSARMLLREFRKSIVDGESIGGEQPPGGFSKWVAHDLDRLDAADAALCEVIRSLKGDRK